MYILAGRQSFDSFEKARGGDDKFGRREQVGDRERVRLYASNIQNKITRVSWAEDMEPSIEKGGFTSTLWLNGVFAPCRRSCHDGSFSSNGRSAGFVICVLYALSATI